KLALDGTYQVFATSAKSSCGELLSNLFNRNPGEETLLFNLGQRLAPDGTLATVVTDVFIKGSGEGAPGSRATVTGSVDAGGKAEIDVDYHATGEGRAYVVRGKLPAQGCGAQARDPNGVPKADHPSKASVVVAGKRLALRGAIRTGDNLLLSAEPKDCSPFTPPSEPPPEQTGRTRRPPG